MDKDHTSVLSNVLATLMFCIPSIVFALSGWLIPLFLYNCVVIYLIITGFTHKIYYTECKKDQFNDFLGFDSLRKAFNKKLIKHHTN